jgi:uncharacterized protein YegJ (DUF2314 family)
MNKLADCRRRHRQHPETFEIPSENDILAIRSGDLVKLIFDDLERMWVEVTAGDGLHFEGRLANAPVFVVGIKLEDRVCFHAKHITEIQPRGTV